MVQATNEEFMYNLQSIKDHLQELFNREEYDLALSYLEDLVSSNNLSNELLSKVYHHIGKILFYRSELKKARRNFVTALMLNSEDFYSKIFLADILEKEGKLYSSLKLLKRAYSENPKSEQLLITIQDKIKYISNDDDEIKDLLARFSSTENIDANHSQPFISILILCYNKVEYTEKCLKTLFDNTNYSNFEVIVVDNASVDDTPGFLESFGERIKFIRSAINLGFVNGNNLAAQYAEGEYLVFLNNDTEVQSNWLNSLYNVFAFKPDAGAVGAKLLYPDGKLQEAGGIVFNDASGWNYGKNDDPADSKYNFVREVDYCSGAALMIRKNIFEKLGGFDQRYSPAYYEDSDLCFGVRKLGYKVYYNPFSNVIHHEGVTSGTDLNSGFKKFQILNSSKFKEKWNEELKRQYPNDPALVPSSSNRNKGKRILIIDDYPPLPTRASGCLKMYRTVKEMIKLGYVVSYAHLIGKGMNKDDQKAIIELKYLGVEFIWFGYEEWWLIRNSPEVKTKLEQLISSLNLHQRKYDLVYLCFWWVAKYFIDLLRKELPQTPIIIDSVDIHYMREERQAALEGNKELLLKAKETKRMELETYSKADCVTVVSDDEIVELKKHLPSKAIFLQTNIHDVRETTVSFDERKDFLFVGSFNHNPNIDACLHLVKDIFPLIKNKIQEVKIFIVGNNPPEIIKNLASDDVIVTGWVAEIDSYIDKCRVFVAPLRYGAGVKGKIGESLASGLPVVTTSIGAEGMGIINGEHAFVTDEVSKFAEYAIELYLNKNIWNEFHLNGKKCIETKFSSKAARKRLEYIISCYSREAFKSNRALFNSHPPKVSIVIATFNQWDYTQKCIESIKKWSANNYEIIVIDNASSDDTVNKLTKKYPEVRLIKNNMNEGFPAAANQGISNALGEFVLLLNNDTVLTEKWLERMIEVIESDKSIGLVGPISNEVSGLQIDKEAKYESIEEMHLYAKKIRETKKGEILNFPRVAFLCTLIKREVFEKIGGLDERFTPGNYEDDDFCLRAQLAGFKTVIAKDVFIHHYGSKSFKAEGEKKYAERLELNKQKFIAKWGVTPDELWLQKKEIKPHQIFYPISKNKFDEHFERVRILLADKELDLALESLQNALENYYKVEQRNYQIEYQDLLDLAGNTALATGNIELAQKYFEEELSLMPNSSSACVGLGDLLFIEEQYENAKMMYEWGVKNNPENSIAVEALQKANVLLGLEKFHNSLN